MKPRGRRRQHVWIPKALRKEVRRYVRSIGKKYSEFFHADSKLKDRVARFVRVTLPPRRGPGRPDNPMVTCAISLHRRLCRKFPEKSSRSVWALVYPRVIVGYAEMSASGLVSPCEEHAFRFYAHKIMHRPTPTSADRPAPLIDIKGD